MGLVKDTVAQSLLKIVFFCLHFSKHTFLICLLLPITLLLQRGTIKLNCFIIKLSILNKFLILYDNVTINLFFNFFYF